VRVGGRPEQHQEAIPNSLERLEGFPTDSSEPHYQQQQQQQKREMKWQQQQEMAATSTLPTLPSSSALAVTRPPSLPSDQTSPSPPPSAGFTLATQPPFSITDGPYGPSTRPFGEYGDDDEDVFETLSNSEPLRSHNGGGAFDARPKRATWAGNVGLSLQLPQQTYSEWSMDSAGGGATASFLTRGDLTLEATSHLLPAASRLGSFHRCCCSSYPPLLPRTRTLSRV
jgi:hypothetical protein